MKNPFFFLFLVLVIQACQDTNLELLKKPNVIIILTDDQGYQDLGCFGAEGFTTPHIDALAAEGVKLTHYYAPQAVCSASRAGLLTGCYPNRIGIHLALMPEDTIGLADEEETIAELAQKSGCRTAIFGKWHLGRQPKFLPLNHGFDEYYGIPYSNDMWPLHPDQGSYFNFPPLPLYENDDIIDTLDGQSQLTVDITKKSVDFIRRNKDSSFLLYIPHPQPHVPLFVSDKFKGSSERGIYGDVIQEIDWSVGEVLKTLEEEGIKENTIVIFTSDNGPWLSYGSHAGSAGPLREGKGTAWEGGQREPFILRYPDRVSPGIIIDEPIMGIDILPTLCDWLRLPYPQLKIDGTSLVDLLEGKEDVNRPEVYFHYYNRNELIAVSMNKWKLYFPHRYRSLAGTETTDDGNPVPYTIIETQGYELYNLEEDIQEQLNVAVEYPDIVATLDSLADDMRSRLGDSLLGVEGNETRGPGTLE